jgi:hypothetical protein
MSIRKTTRAVAAATLALLAGAAVQALPAGAATTACGARCLSVFSSQLGTTDEPNFVEGIFGETPVAGLLVGLKPASNSDPSEDITPHPGPLVSDFYAKGMVSAEVNLHFGTLRAVQLESAPLGSPTGLCVGVERDAYPNEPLTLQPCSIPGRTVFILGPADADGFFPIINASTRDFRHPFAMTYPRHVDVAALPPITLRHLQLRGRERTVPGTQLWGVHFGPVE